jgi:hypothetical protein
MKWAKPKKELDKLRQRLENEILVGPVIKGQTAIKDENLAAVDKYYEGIGDQVSLACLHEKGFRIWRSFKKVPIKYEKTRARYEAFIGGFLFYFEKHDSKIPKDNRTLYFDWGVLNKKADLTIFLNPIYGKINKKVPLKKIGDDCTSNSLSIINGNGKYTAKQNGQEKVKVLKKQTVNKLQAFAIAPPPGTTGPVDPPPPPPPPPPPRD